MNRHTLIWILLVVWIALMATSFAVYMTTEPTGDSFQRGLNRLRLFFTWQGAALLAAMISVMAVRGLAADAGRAVKAAGYLPIVVSGVLWTAVIAAATFAIVTA